jgi:hypothetical protein
MLCQQLQMVWFVGDATSYGIGDLFTAFFSEAPAHLVNNRTISVQAPYLGRAEGRIGDYSAVLQNSPGRIDTFIQLAGSEAGHEPGPAFDGFDFDYGFDFAFAAIGQSQFAPLNCYRQALVTNFVDPTNDRKHANEIFAERTKLNYITEKHIDLVLQTNARLELPEMEYEVNQLLRHTVEESQLFALGGPPSPFLALDLSIHTPMRTEHAYKMMIDINNHPTGRLFDGVQQLSNLKLYAELTKEIAV